MRSFEDELLGDTSEDDHPSTDASEDSVEVQVAPISRPSSGVPEAGRRPPRPFRRAFDHRESSASPLDFSVERFEAGPDSPPPHLSAGAPPTAKASRRKPVEPRKVVEPEGSRPKRPLQEEWVPRKVPRGDAPAATAVTTQGQALPQLGHSPFMGPFVSPHLLLPPSWPHMVRYPYAHLVGGMLGGPPLGFLPSAPYPLLPILPPRASPSLSPQVPEGPPPERNQNARLNGFRGIDAPSRPPSVPSPAPTAGPNLTTTKTVIPKQDFSHKRFLSVESLLSVSSPDPNLEEEGGLRVPPSPHKEPDLQDEDSDAAPLASPSSTVEGASIHSLLQRPASKQKQRNYKNMTRERRIEANARERTRVHTISAAFETLRRAVPAFSHNQKLSKLSVLRIASSYILALSRLTGQDYSRGGTNPSLEECVDLTTKTIQVEGKTKKKRDD